ncbi:AMP-binding protein [Legionella sp. W05-934-2]|jgi:long-chain acyl-CoA synthetase|uniref:AMP-binding protein n=1 Tax=Legionella sp. W05-934-2 TaxID=1198649 RepID=UPI003462FCD5
MSHHIWAQHYNPETKEEIGELAHQHLSSMLSEVAIQYANKVGFSQILPNGMHASLTYQQADELSDAFACFLRNNLNLRQGDRVAVQLPNCLSYAIAVFGILKAGCVLVNTNPLYKAEEMTHQFADAGAKALVIIDMFTDALPEVIPQTAIEHIITVRIDEFYSPIQSGLIRFIQKYVKRVIPHLTLPYTPFSQALEKGKSQLNKGESVKAFIEGLDENSLALLQYTGGTTGVSKGAMLSHKNLISNMMQMLEMVGSYLKSGEETVLTALPLYHIFAFTVNLLGFYFMGSHNILIPSPRPASNMKKAFETYDITWMSAVNTLLNSLLNETWFLENPPKHMKATVSGGMPLHENVAKKWERVTKSPVVEGYGLTESSPLLSFNPLGGKTKINSIGIPAPSTEMKVVNEKGKEMPIGEAGEIIAKGPQIMLGYWQRPEETANTIRDGWLYTGDVATMDEEGYFTIVDRKKDMIIVSGFNVYPNEVESCIAKYDGVMEVAVIGEPNDKTGEAVIAYVVRNSPDMTEENLRQFCKQHLADYKVPRRVIFQQELPKSTVGKILRRSLRKQPNVQTMEVSEPA